MSDTSENKVIVTSDMGTAIFNYIPTCPRGFVDCVNDPAYIKYNYPDWYKELYGDLTPEQASEKYCRKRVDEDPEMNHYCYDD